MRSRQSALGTIASLATLLLPACSVSTRSAGQPAVPVVHAAAPATASQPVQEVSEPPTDTKPDTAEQIPAPPAPAVAIPAGGDGQEVSELQSEIRRLAEREAASREALATLKTMMQARAARPQVTYLGAGATGAFSAPAPPVNEALTPRDDPETTRELAKLQKELQQLETQLASERQQRQELEAQLKQLREETKVGPYADSMSDELVAARRKVQGLEAALASAQRARDDLAAKYEDLKAKRGDEAEQDSATQAQIAALEQRQKEAVQGLERELAASQAREHELRQAIVEAEQTKGEADVSYALVTDLRAQNAALKAKLQQAHDRNTVLTGKLKAASRVADMIFRERVPNDEGTDDEDAY